MKTHTYVEHALAAPTQFVYTDTCGRERVLRAVSLSQAQHAIRRVELERSESIAAADLAATSAQPLS